MEDGVMSFNKITMVGNVGRDPEFRRLSDGAAVCNFNVAVNETARDQRGRSVSEPTWFRVTVWGKYAIVCAESLKKGSAVYVAGRLKPRQWEDKAGERHVSLDVKASDVKFFGLPDSKTVRVA
jgi:single-strand DNA-binding protein